MKRRPCLLRSIQDIFTSGGVLPGVEVKIPFSWQVTWVDGQSTINVASVQPNAAIDAARFAKPAPPP